MPGNHSAPLDHRMWIALGALFLAWWLWDRSPKLWPQHPMSVWHRTGWIALSAAMLTNVAMYQPVIFSIRVAPQLSQGWQKEGKLVSSKYVRTSISRRANHVYAL